MKKILQIGIITIFFSGVYIYYIGLKMNNPVKLLCSFYFAGSMYFFNSNFDGIIEILRNNFMYQLIFWIIHSLAISSTVASFVYLFSKKIRTYLKLLRANWVKRYIIWGVNDKNIIFIKNILRETQNEAREIILVTSKNTDIPVQQQEDLDITYMLINLEDKKLNKRLFLDTPFNKDTYIMILGENYIENVGVATTIINQLPTNTNNERLHIVLNSELEDWINYFSGINACDIKLFNNAKIIARQFLKEYPPYRLIKINSQEAIALSNYTVVIVGFGKIGEQLLLHILEQTQYVGTEFKAIVVDKNMNNLRGMFESKYKGICKNYNIEFLNIDIGTSQFNTLIEDNLSRLNQIIICMQEDEKNLKAGIELKSLIKFSNNINHHIEIMIKCTSHNLFIKKLKEDKEYNNILNFFGNYEDVFTPDILIDEKLDALAKGINDTYNKYNPNYSKHWNDLTPFLKDSNRYNALHIFSKLHLVGLNACKKINVPCAAYVIETKEELLTYLGEIRIKRLSQIEHLRWNAFHFTHGWDLLPLEKAIEWKDKENKLHTCLVSWEELEGVSNKFGIDYKMKDQEQVEHIVDYLKSINYVIYREECC